jgi:hypothetical protein
MQATLDESDLNKNTEAGEDSKTTAIAVARLLIYAVEDLRSIDAFEPGNLVSAALRQLRADFRVHESDLFPSDRQDEPPAE